MTDQATVLKPLTDVVAGQANELIEQTIQGQEHAFQTLIKIALSSTTNLDWTNFKNANGEDRPYLQKTGASKIALRLGASVHIDRDEKGVPIFVREDFEDDEGKMYVYTVSGKVKFSNGRVFEEIGTASTRDQFLGMENQKDEEGNYVKGKDGKNSKIPVALHEALQDAKKKAFSNMITRAITSAVGMGGLGWDDLIKYGITKSDKPQAQFASSKNKKAVPATPLPTPPKTKDGQRASFWPYELGETKERRIYVQVGRHFPEEWIKLHKLRTGQKAGQYWFPLDDTNWKLAITQFDSVEANLDQREPGADE